MTGDTTPPPADAITIDGDAETAYRQGLDDGGAAERQRIREVCSPETLRRVGMQAEHQWGSTIYSRALLRLADLLDGAT